MWSTWPLGACSQGVFLSPVGQLACEDFNLVEVELPAKVHSPSLPKLVGMVEQVCCIPRACSTSQSLSIVIDSANTCLLSCSACALLPLCGLWAVGVHVFTQARLVRGRYNSSMPPLFLDYSHLKHYRLKAFGLSTLSYQLCD